MQRVHRSPQTEEREGSTRRRCISVQLKFNRGYIWSRGVIRRHRHLGTRRSTHAASRRPRTALSAIKTEWANAYAKWLITPSGAANEARGLYTASFMFLAMKWALLCTAHAAYKSSLSVYDISKAFTANCWFSASFLLLDLMALVCRATFFYLMEHISNIKNFNCRKFNLKLNSVNMPTWENYFWLLWLWRYLY